MRSERGATGADRAHSWSWGSRRDASTGQPIGSVKVGDNAVCAICAVKEGTNSPEAVAAVLDYKGKTYAFCNEGEKAEFISNPTKYAGTQ